MSTRGVYGFRIDHTDKVAFAQAPAYPEHLERKILEYIASNDHASIFQQANDLTLTARNSEPKFESPTDLVFASQIPNVIDFVKYTSCQWAYIINVDSGKLEIHSGSKLNNYFPEGRYISSKNSPLFTGPMLIDEIPLNVVRPESISHLIKTIKVANEKFYYLSQLIESSSNNVELEKRLRESKLSALSTKVLNFVGIKI